MSFFDRSGRFQGEIGAGGQVFDRTGRNIGKVVGDRAFSPTGEYLGRVRDNQIFDATSSRTGEMRGDQVFDETARNVGRASTRGEGGFLSRLFRK